MKGITYLGVLVQLIGAILLIYIGLQVVTSLIRGLIIGLLLVVFGFLIHIFLDKKLNSLPSSY